MSNERNIEWIEVNEPIIPEDDQLRGRTVDVVYLDEVMEFPQVSIEKVEQVRAGLEKTAQHRSFLQKLHEKFNLPRAAGEAFSSNYQEQMRLLRDVDDSIRRMAANIKPSLGLAKTALKQRRYLDIIHFIGNINDDLRAIVNERHLLKKALNHHLEDFYGDYEHADLGREYFRKNAGIMDWFQDNSRRKAGKLFEKMYENVLKERKRAVNQLYDELAVLVEFTMETLKDLGTYRARGDIGSYVGDLDKLAKKRDVFEVKFKQVYDTYIKPMIDKIKQEQAEKEEAFGNVMPEKAPAVEKPVKKPEVPRAEEDYGYGDEPAWPERASEAVSEPEVVEPAPAVKTAPVGKQKQNIQVQPPSPQAIEIVTQGPAGSEEEYELPAWAKAPIPAAQNVPITEVTRDDKGKPINVRRKLPMQAEEVIVTLIKSGNARHLVKQALLAYSEEFEEMGDVEGSLMCLAAAENDEIPEKPTEEDYELAETYDAGKQNRDYEAQAAAEKVDEYNDYLAKQKPPKAPRDQKVKSSVFDHDLNEKANEIHYIISQENRRPTAEEQKILDLSYAQIKAEENRMYGNMSDEKLIEFIKRGALRDMVNERMHGDTDFSAKELQKKYNGSDFKNLPYEELDKKYGGFVPVNIQEFSAGIKVIVSGRTVGFGSTQKEALTSAMSYYWA